MRSIAGEADNIATDVENLIGGNGNDQLTGSALANALTGGLGADKITGGAGSDTIYARDKVIDTVNGSGGVDSAQLDKNDIRKAIEKLLK